MLSITQLFVYPVKSLGGATVSSALVTDRGLQHDRRWMLVDNYNRFMTQREMPALAQFQTFITGEGLVISHLSSGSLTIPFDAPAGEEIEVRIWKDMCGAELVSSVADEWFSNALSHHCRLVRMPDRTHRGVDPILAPNSINSFSDDYPFLLLGQSSLDDLNSRLALPVPVNRFRPNIVFSGGEPFDEDHLAHFRIRDIDFFGVKLCARCVVITIDQQSTQKAKEPLATLASYRQWDKKVYFGQNLIHRGSGLIEVGDVMEA